MSVTPTTDEQNGGSSNLVNPFDSKSYYIKVAQEAAESNPASYQLLLTAMMLHGISEENARYGLDNCNIDWNKQASRVVAEYKNKDDIKDSIIKYHLVNSYLFTDEQAEAGIELYYEENNISRSKTLKFYGTTTVKYLDTTIELLDTGNYKINSHFTVSSTEKCAIEFGVCYFNDYKEELNKLKKWLKQKLKREIVH